MITLPPLTSLQILMERPGQKYIAHGGKELYVSHPSGVLLLTGPDFRAMNADEIETYVNEQLSSQ